MPRAATRTMDAAEAEVMRDFGLDPGQFRVSPEPMARKQRASTDKTDPEPQYAKAVWFSYQSGQPLEVEVPKKRSVTSQGAASTVPLDTIRALKRAARWLQRHKTDGGKPVEVRVQVAVEDIPDKPRTALVKFLGHKPYELGRRIQKIRDEREAAAEAPAPGQHRKRTTAVSRSHEAALRGTVVRAVIRPAKPCPIGAPGQGFRVPGRVGCFGVIIPIDSPHQWGFIGKRGGQGMKVYREYIETDDGVLTVRMCHDFPQIAPGNDNHVVIFSEDVARAMDAAMWGHEDMPTAKWAVLAV